MTLKELEAKYEQQDEQLRGAYALIRELREIVKGNSAEVKELGDKLVFADRELGRMQNWIKKHETRDIIHRQTLNAVYGVKSELESIEYNEKPKEVSEAEKIDNALITLRDVCRGEACCLCRFCGDSRTATTCKLVKTIPCGWGTLVEKEETK